MWNRCEGIVRNTTGEEVRREATCRLANFTPLAHLSLRHKANKYEHHLTSRTWRLFSGMFNASDLSFMTFQLCSSWNAVLAGTRSGQKRNVQRIQIRTRFGRKKLFNEKRTFFFFLERQTEPRWVRTCALLAPLEGALCNFDVTYLFFTGIRGWSERAALFDRKYENQGLDIGSGLWETYGLMNWVEGLNVHREWEDYSVQDVCMHVIPEK